MFKAKCIPVTKIIGAPKKINNHKDKFDLGASAPKSTENAIIIGSNINAAVAPNKLPKAGV